jgi:hypothetical protein
MPRFFLNVIKNGVFFQDPEGDEASDLPAIRDIAIDTLREMRRLPHAYGAPHMWETREFAITDESGSVLMMIPFSYAAA